MQWESDVPNVAQVVGVTQHRVRRACSSPRRLTGQDSGPSSRRCGFDFRRGESVDQAWTPDGSLTIPYRDSQKLSET